MPESKVKYATVEVSSQSYKRYRLEGIEFEYGIFLNIDKDHISSVEHSSFEEYLSCKCELLKHCNNVLININTKYLKEIMQAAKGKNIVLFGENNKADYYVYEICKKKEGFSFIVRNDKLNYENEFNIKMVGRFNVENALAAIAMAKIMKIDDDSIKKGLLKTFVPGRMNIYESMGRTVVIDYAHNKLSFQRLYETLRLDYPDRRIISVGGTVGGKAYNRRKEFGQIVGKSSSYIILTANDPQFEDVNDICKEIGRYIPSYCKYEIIEDRKEAIDRAFNYSKSGDVIVLLSKGIDKYQKVENKQIPYESDIKIVEDKFAKK